MSSHHSQKVTNLVESLCQLGCSKVTLLLKDIKNGNEIEAFADLSRDEIEQVTDELESIMSVYSCDSDNVTNNNN